MKTTDLNELADLHQNDHPGYVLADWYETAFPAYEVYMRARVLVEEALPPVQQFVLRAADIGANTLDDVCGVLGLQANLVTATLEQLERLGCLAVLPAKPKDRAPERFVTTTKGRQVLGELVLQRPREEAFNACLDGVTGEYFPHRRLRTTKSVREAELHQIPAYITSPSMADLDLIALKRLWRDWRYTATLDMRKSELLDLIDLENAFVGYLSMRVLQFIRESDGAVLVQVYDGVDRSPRHEAGLLRMEAEGMHALRAERKPSQLEPTGQDPARELVDPVVYAAAVRKAAEVPPLEAEITALQNQIAIAGQARQQASFAEDKQSADNEIGDLQAQIAQLRDQVTALKSASSAVDVLSTAQHRPKLLEALRDAKERVIIVSPWLKLNAVDQELRTDIAEALRRGVQVWIGYGFSEADVQEKRTLEKLQELQKGKGGKNLRIQHLGSSHAKVVICDSRYMITTSFNWLSFAGREEWGSRIEFGTLVRDPASVQAMLQRLQPLFGVPEATPSPVDSHISSVRNSAGTAKADIATASPPKPESTGRAEHVAGRQPITPRIQVGNEDAIPFQTVGGLRYLDESTFALAFRPIAEQPRAFVHTKLDAVFVLVSPGPFIMGSPMSENGRRKDEAQHRAELDHYVLICETPCTQQMYTYDGRKNPSQYIHPLKAVERVSWRDARSWCELLGLDLLTECEWEYACRAGTATPYHTGATITRQQATFGDRQNSYPVKAHGCPNSWGMHDMHGHVWEWCLDAYGNYPTSSTVDYVHLDEGEIDKVTRGGCWRSDEGSIRSAVRGHFRASYESDRFGFRPVARLSKSLGERVLGGNR
jgi:formylglycine-generating enzyme required for sulfatase activity